MTAVTYPALSNPMNARKLAPAGVAAALLALSALAVRYAIHVPDVVPSSAPAAMFSAERAMQHVSDLTSRRSPSALIRNQIARDYLLQELRFIGVEPVVQTTTGVGTRYAVVGAVTNVLARLPGMQPGGPAVLLMAHYDAVPASPGAGDDGSGTAVLLEALRALRSGPRLRHDVIALFTDQEETGLLGAAAFAREHPWARDVAVVLNFEARGTFGPSLMFETGPGNLDAVRMLRRVPGVRATSLSAAVYRQLPNDTDLSELMMLGLPAMNFAFIGGVERYHSAEDDVMHLDPRSVQGHGNQAVALARGFANADLPRPRTGDGIFFDFPLVGLVVYPEWLGAVFAALALVLAIAVIIRSRRPGVQTTVGVVAGTVATLAAIVVAALCGALAAYVLQRLHGLSAVGGRPEWSGVYAAAIAALAVTVAAAIYAIARRLGSTSTLYAGIVLFWALLAALTTVLMPGGAFVFTWPAIVMSATALICDRWPRWRLIPMWIGSAIALFAVVPIVYVMACLALGVGVVGAAVVGIFVAALTCLLAPLLEVMAAASARVWQIPAGSAVVSLLLFAIGAFTVRTTARHPGGAALIYGVDADSGTGWLTGYAWGASSHTALLGVLRVAAEGRAAATSKPGWIGGGPNTPLLQVPALPLPAPSVSVQSDVSSGGQRHLSMRVRPGGPRLSVYLTANPGVVLDAAVNGRPIDVRRYRRHTAQWMLEFAAPPDSGFTLALTMDPSAHGIIGVRGVAQGIPPMPELHLPRRPEHILPVQDGDMTWIYTRVPF